MGFKFVASASGGQPGRRRGCSCTQVVSERDSLNKHRSCWRTLKERIPRGGQSAVRTMKVAEALFETAEVLSSCLGKDRGGGIREGAMSTPHIAAHILTRGLPLVEEN